MKYRTIYFTDGKLRVLDQSKLPKIEYVECRTHYEVHTAIKSKQICGSTTIGIAAAYGMALSPENLILPNGADITKWDDLLIELLKVKEFLIEACPISANLSWAVNRMLGNAKEFKSLNCLYNSMVSVANCLATEEQYACTVIGEIGGKLIQNGMQVLTRGNVGSLAAPEIGTALAPIYWAHKEGKKFNIYVGESQSRLTIWELKESGIEPILIYNDVVAQLMKEKRIDLIIVGADRIHQNGDTISEIGTYGLAVLAKYHNVPFYIAAPFSTFDFKSENIRVEQGQVTADVSTYNPLFDVTPHNLITGIITDLGTIKPVNEQQVEKLLAY